MTYGAFGDLLRQIIARKHGLTQTRLAHLIGYDQAVLTRMSQGKKDLTGPSGRERVVQIIGALHDEGVLSTQAEANALLKAGGMAPLYDGQSIEAALLRALKTEPASTTIAHTPDVRPTPQPHTNLPAQLSSFIGREREMAEVTRLLGTTRLLTLTGSGGAGKTRLAIEVGTTLMATTSRATVNRATASVAPTFSDGVWMVEFAALSEGRLVSDMVATAFGLHAMSRTSEEVLVEHLRDKHLLLILDNCEHLIADCAVLAVKLLQTCPQIRLLVTSRERLNVPGEVTWRVPSLAHDEATALFVERARAVRSDFAVDESNASFVEHICERLDVMPLALELAAARLHSFSVEQIAARLDDAFRVLTGGSRTALPRQQTLRATIDWSYELLPAEERTLLRELAVFAGGWTLEAAEAVHGPDTLDLLDQLVSKSLVIIDENSVGTRGMRYRLLETIRQYACDALRMIGQDAEHQVRQHHLQYYTKFSINVFDHLANTNEAKTWKDIAEYEIDNLRASLSWAASCGDWQSGQQIVASMREFWFHPGWAVEIAQWIDALILSNPTACDTARVSGLLIKGNVLQATGDMVGGVDWFQKAAALAYQIGDEPLWLESTGSLGWVTPDYAVSMSLLNSVIDVSHRSGRKFDEIRARNFQGERMCLKGDYEQAIATLEKSLELSRELDSPILRNIASGFQLIRLGEVYLFSGNLSRARTLLEEGIPSIRRGFWFPDPLLLDLTTVCLLMDDYVSARETLREYLPFSLEFDNLERFAQGLVLGAGLAQGLGNLDTAAQLLGASTAIRKVHHTHGVFEPELFAEYDRRLPAVRAAMEPEAFERAWDAGQALTHKEALAITMAL